MLNTDKLQALASTATAPPELRRIAAALAAAMNDWPTQDLETLDEFISELKAEFAPLTFENIKAASLNVKVRADAWKGETLNDLLEAWGPDDQQKNLEELIDRLCEFIGDK